MTHSRRSVILVMHPEPLIRAGIAATLREHGFDVVLRETHAGRVAEPANTVPDLVVCDHATGLALAAREKDFASVPPQRLLVIGHDEREAAVHAAMALGVHGYLGQAISAEELVQAVLALLQGLRYLSRAAAQGIATSLCEARLTQRELDVLDLLACGQCNKDIARTLNLAPGTVKTHIGSILGKLRASSRTQAVSIAMQRGLVGSRPAEPHLPAPTVAFRALKRPDAAPALA